MNATRDGNGAWRTVNRVLMEDYLYSVVPSESIPSWADSGGREALRAQAIAARSYAAAERRYGYAQTCDTQSCQVYRGSSNEDWRTTEAVRTTSGTVIKRGNQIMAAEFSSSSGGFTAGGVFPAVVDEGDVVSPNRNWQQTVTAGAIANAYGVGELISFDVIGRNNLGADGGRVTRVKVVGTARTVEGSGDEARWKLGLKSDWFTVGGPGAPGPIRACRSRRARSSRCRCRSCRRCPRSPRGRWSRSCRRCPRCPRCRRARPHPSRSLLQRVTRSPNPSLLPWSKLPPRRRSRPSTPSIGNSAARPARWVNRQDPS